MPEVFILVERHEGGWTATARDDVGTITARTCNLRAEAVKRVKIDVERVYETACRFTVQGMGE